MTLRDLLAAHERIISFKEVPSSRGPQNIILINTKLTINFTLRWGHCFSIHLPGLQVPSPQGLLLNWEGNKLDTSPLCSLNIILSKVFLKEPAATEPMESF